MQENTDRAASERPSQGSFQPETRASEEPPASTTLLSDVGGVAGDEAGVRRRKRRGSRGGRGRRRKGASAADEGAESPPPSEEPMEASKDSDDAPRARAEASESTPSRRKRRRRRRGGEVDATEDEPRAEAPDEDGEAVSESPRSAGSSGQAAAEGSPSRRKRRRRGGRLRRGGEAPVELEAIPGEEDDLPPAVGTRRVKRSDEDAQERTPAEPAARKKRRRRRTKADEAAEGEAEYDDDRLAPEVPRTSRILVNASDQEEQRVAVIHDGQIVEFQMTVGSSKTLVSDIYRGRVVNLEPAIGAAFVDFGQGRNGFLHTSDVLSAYGEKDWSLDKLLTTKIDPEEFEADAPGEAPVAEEDEGAKRDGRDRRSRRPRARPRLPITDLLKKGQNVVVQVTKDAIGDKGPTLTTYISIPGRYLVLMPSMTRTGVSRKIEDEKERRRLKRILESLEVPPGMGVIVRTAGVGRTKADLKRDLDYLRSAWESFGKKLRQGSGPAPLYRESDVAIRTMRDLFGSDVEEVVVDDPEVHARMVEFTEKLMPENVDRIRLHSGPRPLFHTYSIEQDFERIFTRRIELPSGGSIVFDQTEALVSIDVNSGRTRSEGHDFEEIALKTNLEAVPEIARQIRLRDLGGILVVDFIDMQRSSNQRGVERAFREALSTDRARSKIGRISQFGLLEMTRQRLGPGIQKKLFQTCPHCRGTGRARTSASRAAAILRRLGSALTLKGFTRVEVRTAPDAVDHLKELCSDELRALEYVHQREIELVPVPDQLEDSILRYLRADGREVRPGGRRKR